jgi:hypothetical protein
LPMPASPSISTSTRRPLSQEATNSRRVHTRGPVEEAAGSDHEPRALPQPGARIFSADKVPLMPAFTIPGQIADCRTVPGGGEGQGPGDPRLLDAPQRRHLLPLLRRSQGRGRPPQGPGASLRTATPLSGAGRGPSAGGGPTWVPGPPWPFPQLPAEVLAQDELSRHPLKVTRRSWTRRSRRQYRSRPGRPGCCWT